MDCRNSCNEPCACNCEAFQEAQWAIEGKNTAIEGSAWNMSAMRNTPPATDVRYGRPPYNPFDTKHAQGGKEWNSGPPTNAWSSNETWGQDNGYGHGNNPPNSGSASCLPAQIRNPTAGAIRTGMSGRYAMPHGRISHPAFQDQFAETTDSCMRWTPDEQVGKRDRWDTFASGGVKADDERRELTQDEGSGFEAKKNVKGKGKAVPESSRDAGGGRMRFQGEHVPAAWKAKDNRR